MATIRNRNSLGKITWRLARHLEHAAFEGASDSLKRIWPFYTPHSYYDKAKKILFAGKADNQQTEGE